MAESKMKELLITELRDIYNAEMQITRALPKMSRRTQHAELRRAFEEHLEQTRGQIERLDRIFEEMDIRKGSKKCHAVEGMIEEVMELLDMDLDPDVIDAGLIGAQQKVEHYEIASYGTARTWARELGMEKVAKLLEETLQEERQTDERLTKLAESRVNKDAEKRAAS